MPSTGWPGLWPPNTGPGDGRRVSTTSDLGAHGERIATAYLTDAGLRMLDRNWRCREGELDKPDLELPENPRLPG